MRSLSEALVFVGLAVGAHVALAASIDLTGLRTGVPPDEEERRDVTVAALAGSAQDLVDLWESTPDVGARPPSQARPEAPDDPTVVAPPDAAPARVAPVADVVEARPATVALPQVPQAPVRVFAEASDTAPTPPNQPDLAPAAPQVAALAAPALPLANRPALGRLDQPGGAPVLAMAPPEAPLPQRARSAPAERPPPRAAAPPQVEAAQPAPASQPTAAPAQPVADPTLIVQWESRIRSRIQSRLREPPGNWPEVEAVVRVRVSPDGTVLQAFLVRLTGDPRLDGAAINAVMRAGRLPRAPTGLPDENQVFDVPVEFGR